MRRHVRCVRTRLYAQRVVPNRPTGGRPSRNLRGDPLTKLLFREAPPVSFVRVLLRTARIARRASLFGNMMRLLMSPSSNGDDDASDEDMPGLRLPDAGEGVQTPSPGQGDEGRSSNRLPQWVLHSPSSCGSECCDHGALDNADDGAATALANPQTADVQHPELLSPSQESGGLASAAANAISDKFTGLTSMIPERLLVFMGNAYERWSSPRRRQESQKDSPLSAKRPKHNTCGRPSRALRDAALAPDASGNGAGAVVTAAASSGIGRDGAMHGLQQCRLPSTGRPCHVDAFAKFSLPENVSSLEPADLPIAGETPFSYHRRMFLSCSESARHEFIFQRLKAGFNGKAIHYRINAVPVCRDVFLLAYPTSSSTLTRIHQRVMSSKGAAISYKVREEEGSSVRMIKDIDLECVADLLFWSEENGSELIGLDYLSGNLYVPKVDITDILKEVRMH